MASIKNVKIDDIFWDNMKILSLEPRKTHRKCNCQCLKCGRIFDIFLYSIVSGKSKNCKFCRRKNTIKIGVNIGDIIYNGWKVINPYNGIDKYKSRILEVQCSKCSKVYNKTLSDIKKCKQCGICRGIEHGNKLRRGNISPLLEDNPLSWYYMGFILADGGFEKNKDNNSSLKIDLAAKDKDYLNELALFLKSKINGPYPTYDSNGKKCQDHYRLAIGDSVLIPKICTLYDIKYTIKNNKTKNPPNVNKLNWSNKQKLSIACGFIDGDGSRKGWKGFSIRNHLSWLNMHKYIFNGLYTECKLNRNQLYKDKFEAYTYIGVYGFNKLINHINKYSLPVMKRKWYA